MPIQVQGNMSKLYLFYVYKSNECFFIRKKPLQLCAPWYNINFRFHAIYHTMYQHTYIPHLVYRYYHCLPPLAHYHPQHHLI